jgi:rsbT co-antagonist protein RsbR
MYSLQQGLTPQTSDENLRRQGFLVIIVSITVTLLSLVLGLNSVRSAGLGLTAALTLSSALVYLVCAGMARYGIVRPAALLVTWVPWLVIMTAMLNNPSSMTLSFLSIPILLASITLSSLQILPVSLLGLAIALVAITRGETPGDESFTVAFSFVLMISALAYLSAWSVERALGSTREARRELELSNKALNTTNSDLEARVVERTADLQEREGKLHETLAELHETLEELRSSQEMIRELSAPILPVAPGVLVAPMIGAVDSGRAAVFMSNLLDAAERERARYLIIDVTGIPVIDTQVARVILQAAQAMRMLGAQAILTGIRPEVAQTLVGLGIDLSGLITRGTLQSGIAEALGRMSVAS